MWSPSKDSLSSGFSLAVRFSLWTRSSLHLCPLLVKGGMATVWNQRLGWSLPTGTAVYRLLFLMSSLRNQTWRSEIIGFPLRLKVAEGWDQPLCSLYLNLVNAIGPRWWTNEIYSPYNQIHRSTCAGVRLLRTAGPRGSLMYESYV